MFLKKGNILRLINQEEKKKVGGEEEQEIKRECRKKMKNERKTKEGGRQTGHTFLYIICILVGGFHHWFLLSPFRVRRLLNSH